MFEDNSDFDFDDDILSSSSFPTSINTGSPSTVNSTRKKLNNEVEISHKRSNEEDSLSVNKRIKTIHNVFDEAKPSNILLGTISDYSKIVGTFQKENVNFNRYIATISPKVVKRKFPGPAGILPELSNNKLNLDSPLKEKHEQQDIICSQLSIKEFEDGPWETMSIDFCDCSIDNVSLLDKYNIEWIKRNADANMLVNQKAPFLAALIQNIECLDSKFPVIKIILKDKTGTIQGTILHNLYEKYEYNFIAGAVLILKQFSILTTSNKNHYLTITPNNLLTIYAPKSKSENIDEELSNHSNVWKISVQSFDKEELIRNIKLEIENLPIKRSFNTTSNQSKNLTSLTFPKKSSINTFKATTSETDTNQNTNLLGLSLKRTKSCNDQIYHSARQETNLTCSSTNKIFEVHKLNITCLGNNKRPTSNIFQEQDIFLNDDFEIPDNFEKSIAQEPLINTKVNEINLVSASQKIKEPWNEKKNAPDQNKKFIFKSNINKYLETEINHDNSNIVGNCSQMSIKTDVEEHSEIWQNVLDGIDADSLFEDF